MMVLTCVCGPESVLSTYYGTPGARSRQINHQQDQGLIPAADAADASAGGKASSNGKLS